MNHKPDSVTWPPKTPI